MVALTLHTAQMKKLQRAVAHIKDGVPKVLSPAINRSLNAGRTAVRREIRKEYLIKQKDIPIRVSGASRARLNGQIIIQQGMLDASKFFYRPIAVQRGRARRPLFVQIKKGGGGYISGGFIASVGGADRPVQRTQPARLPIRRIITIGAAIMASQPTVGPAVNKAMGDTLDKRIDYEMKRVLARAGGHA